MLHKINLMDWRSEQSRRRRVRLHCLLIFSGCLFCASQRFFYLHSEQRRVARQQTEITLQARNDELSQLLRQRQLQQKTMEKVRDERKRIEHWLWLSHLPEWLMKMLKSSVPADVYLEDIQLTDLQVMIRGLGKRSADIALFVRQLRQCEQIRQLVLRSVVDKAPHWGERLQSFQLSFALEPSAATEPRHADTEVGQDGKGSTDAEY